MLRCRERRVRRESQVIRGVVVRWVMRRLPVSMPRREIMVSWEESFCGGVLVRVVKGDGDGGGKVEECGQKEEEGEGEGSGKGSGMRG